MPIAKASVQRGLANGQIYRSTYPVAGHPLKIQSVTPIFHCDFSTIQFNLINMYFVVIASARFALHVRNASSHLHNKVYFHSGRVLSSSRIDAYNKWYSKFIKEGVSEPGESIETILSHIQQKELSHPLHQKQYLSREEEDILESLCECRMARMPLQYIIGEWQFRRLNLKLYPPVFIPRPETETLVGIILERLSRETDTINILEVGCGSGAISLALAQENPKVICTAIDQCDLACRLARTNSSALKLSDRVNILWAKLNREGEIIDCHSKSKLVDGLPPKIDIVVSNPPYIPSPDIFHLQPEILLYEDLKALDGGKDGLEVVLPLLKFASTQLESSPSSDGRGKLFIEVDPIHPPLIQKWLCDEETSKLQLLMKGVHLDLFGKKRFVELDKV